MPELPEVPLTEKYFLGLDVGRRRDDAALVVLGRAWRQPDPSGPPESIYYAILVRRFELGTPCHDIERETADTFSSIKLRGEPTNLIVDQSGVGDPVVEALRREHHIRTVGVVITGGETTSLPRPDEYHVAKGQLATHAVRAFEARRLKVHPDAGNVDEFRKELEDSGIKPTRTNAVAYEALDEATHDDLVIACGLGIWYGETQARPIDPTRRRGAYVDRAALAYDPLAG